MVGAAGLTFALALPGKAAHAAAQASERVGKALNPWLSIAPDGTITIMSAATEMGQGSMTSLPLILAEELDADWSKVRIVPVPPIDRLYANPAYGMIYTAGSNAVRVYFQPLRMFGAQARRVLLDNAAKKLGVPVEELTTEPSVVVHAKSGRRLSYGEIAAFAEIPDEGAGDQAGPAEAAEPVPPDRQGRDARRGAGQGERPRAIRDRRAAARACSTARCCARRSRAPAPERIDDAKARAVAGVVEGGPAAVRRRRGRRNAVGGVRRASVRSPALSPGPRPPRPGASTATRASADFAAAARDLKQPSTDWFKAGDAARRAEPRPPPTMDATYLSDYAYHAQMEPLNAVASVSASGDAAEIWTGTQSPTTAQEATAKALGISRDQVKLNDLADGWRLRPARPARLRLHRRCGAAGEGRRPAREGDVDARGRSPQRALPAAVGALPAGRPRWRRAGSSPGTIAMSATG